MNEWLNQVEWLCPGDKDGREEDPRELVLIRIPHALLLLKFSREFTGCDNMV